MLEDYLSTTEAAYYLGKCTETLRRWGREGNGPIKPVKIAGRFVWRINDVKSLLESRESKLYELTELQT